MTVTYRGTTALITGASSGLGVEFATRIAERGANVVLVARRTERLESLATELAQAHGVMATAISWDLAVPGAGLALKAELDARDVRIQTLVNNAGFGTHGDFTQEDPARIAAEIQLNVGTLVELTRAFLPAMLDGGLGAVVNVASTAAYQPTPGMAVYGATKAFVLNFTEALAYETRESSLAVLALSPGATRTEFFDVLGSEAAAVGRFQTPHQVVATALAALERAKPPASVVSGLANRVSSRGASLMPRPMALSVSGRLLAD